MAIKLYFSPSDQTGNLYKVGNTNEAVQCRAIADLCVAAAKRCGFDAMTNKTGSMYDRVKESNAWGANSHIPIHTNAHNGEVAGFRGFYYKAGGEGYKLLSAIEDAVAPITPGTSDGLSARPGLYEVSASNAPCAYLELGFHDNPTEAQYIIDHKKELAEAIVKGACKHHGVKYVPEKATEDKPASEKPATTGKMYRVFVDEKQHGAFRNLDNALRAAREYLLNGEDVKLTVRDK